MQPAELREASSGVIVLVTHDDARSLPPVLAEIDDAAVQLRRSGIALRLVVVDAGSTDGTPEIARRHAERYGLPIDRLSAADPRPWQAFQEGLTWAIEAFAPDFVVTLDAEGHHDARQLPDLVRAHLARGSGITIGSRWVRGGSAPGTPLLRRALSRVASRMVGRATGLRRVRDITTAFRVLDPDVVKVVGDDHATVGGYGFYCEYVAVAQASGFRIDEVPIVFRPRYSGVEELSNRDLVRFWRDVQLIRARVLEIRVQMRYDQATWAARSGRLRGQEARHGSVFGATEELATLAEARRFVDWILSEFRAHLGSRIVEVGAGLGTISIEIARTRPHTEVVALEPANNVYAELVARSADVPNLVAHQQTSGELLAAGAAGAFDTALYVNVLEHIRDDVDELRTAYELLAPGGTLCLFVPAMPRLYGSLDFKSGHYRRYGREHLANVVDAAGFDVVDVHHFDVAGVAPYWFMYRLLDVSRLDRFSSDAYDRVVVPLSRVVQRAVPDPPIGKNLVVVARKPR